MCTRGDSKAAKPARQATRPPVLTNGSEASARSRASNARHVPTVGSFRSRTTSFRSHVSGVDAEGQPFVAGVYPLIQDETCFFLAVDFDKATWRDDAAALLDTCRDLNLPAALERSRSGRGAHVWFFFDEATPAALARRLGSHVLTETMERRPDIGLDSYDRLFPNQDTLPHGGFGKLITDRAQ